MKDIVFIAVMALMSMITMFALILLISFQPCVSCRCNGGANDYQPPTEVF